VYERVENAWARERERLATESYGKEQQKLLKQMHHSVQKLQ